ncbi:MAG: hypoxanthine phosphoribosyltransferase, partial [Phycisphaerales bacterium]|nr:hypoxanthine phosphoribosyltransferase [Phycisphaerales bacterium]
MTAEPPHSDLSVVLVGRDEIAQRVAEMAATLDAHFADIDQPLVV